MANPPNPGNAGSINALLALLASQEFQTLRENEPEEAETQLKALLTQLGAKVPDDLTALLKNAPGAQVYQDLLKELEDYQNPLTGPSGVQKLLKLAPPPVFGIHCPITDKLA